MKPIIRVENLSKQYRLGANQSPQMTFRETLVAAAKSPINKFKKTDEQKEAQSFWALKDVNFEIYPGEVVGIIGRNGAGKSTLLKILSRITEPTTGKIELFGRVGSLLEVGTGFHPELTGRENIFLNGAILGMRREEIARKFDEIVDFAEVEKFIDTPVKHYSSGMYTRLAFAVAANLEPEILIVDEVLAVGDAEFQKKCLGKMKDVSEHGRTVIFVSHNIKAIQQLCNTCIYLKSGKVVMKGDTAVVSNHYVKATTILENNPLDRASVIEVLVIDKRGNETNLINYREPIKIRVKVCINSPIVKPSLDIAFYNNDTRLFGLQSEKLAPVELIEAGVWTVEFNIELGDLIAEDVTLDIGIKESGQNYFLLLESIKKLSINYSTLPTDAVTDCILLPESTCLQTVN